MKIHYKNPDIESTQEMLKEHNIQLESIQVSRGIHSSETEGLLFPTIRLSKITQMASSVVFMNGRNPCDDFNLQIPMDNSYIKINGKKISAEGFNLSAPNEILQIPASLYSSRKRVNLYFSKSVLADHIGQNEVETLIKQLPAIRGKKDNSNLFIEHQKEMVTYVNQVINSSVIFDFQAIKDIEETLYTFISSLISSFDDVTGQITDRRLTNHLSIIQRVLDFLESTATINISKPLILEQAFCSARALDYAFQSVIGIPFKKYIILRRMHLIKKELLHTEDIVMKNIVKKYGVVNVGRFTSDFHTLFGVHPKELVFK